MSIKKKIALLLFLLCFICFSLLTFRIIKVNAEVQKQQYKVETATYLDKYDISNVDFSKLNDELNRIEAEVLTKEITINVNGYNKKVTLKDIGIEVDKKSIKEEIFRYENHQDYMDKFAKTSSNKYENKQYSLKYIINEEKTLEFLKDLKTREDKEPQKGKLVMNKKTRELTYEGEVVGYTLDVDKSLEAVKNSIVEGNYSDSINIMGTNKSTTDKYKLINTKISSVTTEFDNKVSRAINLDVAAKSIDGVIVKPGEVFSYFKYAGPFNRSDYVYYNGVKGNGVCQVATTLYDAELMAGLKTISRSSHPDMPKYVPGGLDTAVSQSKNGYVADFRFKNTYSYPLYISAFIKKDKLTVEIWSNEKATKGVTYKLRSVKKAYASYDAYRDSYKDGKKIKTEYLGHSWYYTEVK